MKIRSLALQWLLLPLSFLVFVHLQAATPEVAKTLEYSLTKPAEPVALSVDKELINLIDLFKASAPSAPKRLVSVQENTDQFNAAEHYLLLVAQAIQANNQRDFLLVSQLLEQAEALSNKITEEQLNQPIFSQLHLILAASYAELKQYDLAFLQKKTYMKKFYAFSRFQRKHTIELLTEKHELTRKTEGNELLQNENKLKALQISETKHQKQNHQYTVLLVVVIMVVFILLFLRQLIIRRKLIQLARIDVLTGLANRAMLFEQGETLVNKSTKENVELSVVLLDIDAFKTINDQLGHQIGDDVLKVIAQLGGEAMRSRDLFCRLGGEEFVALLPKTGIAEAKAIAERIKEKIAEHNFKFLGIKTPITASLGIASLQQVNDTFERLLHAADLAMYQAKAQGKNRVISYDSIANQQERRSH